MMWRRLASIPHALLSRPGTEERIPIGWSELVVSWRGAPIPSKLMVVAHPDDESLYGGEALTASGGWTVVCVTNGTNGTRRAEFAAAMVSIGANFTILGHFDHLSSGNFSARLEDQLAGLLGEFPYELVVTHNELGEYGHPQHRALHRMVRRLAAARPLYVFDAPWTVWPRMSAAKRALLQYYPSQRASIDLAWFTAARERLRRIA